MHDVAYTAGNRPGCRVPPHLRQRLVNVIHRLIPHASGFNFFSEVLEDGRPARKPALFFNTKKEITATDLDTLRVMGLTRMYYDSSRRRLDGTLGLYDNHFHLHRDWTIRTRARAVRKLGSCHME